MTRTNRWAGRALVVLVPAALLAACGSADETAAPAPSTDVADEPTTATSRAEPASPGGSSDEGCGVTLAEVQALLPGDSGVAQNETPDARRCNFTWDDAGPRGIDVALLVGGRSSFDPPPGFEPVDGYGDEAYTSTESRRASAIAPAGDDLFAVDVSATSPSDDLVDLALDLLELALD